MEQIDNIIGQITEKLTGDAVKDLKFLRAQAIVYKDHEYSTEIVRAIGRIIFDKLPKDKVKDYINTIDNFNIYLENLVFNARLSITDKNYTEAERLLDKAFEIRNLFFTSDKSTDYLYFNNFYEKIIYKLKFKPVKELKEKPIYYREMYLLFGFLLIEVNKLDKAREVLNEAILSNPLDTNVYFELGETFKLEKKWEDFKANTDKAFNFSYNSESLARCYRNYGYYFIEMENYEAAIASFLKSTLYEESAIAMSEIFYIQQITDKKVSIKEYLKVCDDILAGSSIDTMPHRDILMYTLSTAELFENEKQYQVAIFFYKVLFDIFKDENFSIKIVELSNLLEEKT